MRVSDAGTPVPSERVSVGGDHMLGAGRAADDGWVDRGSGGGWGRRATVTTALRVAWAELEAVWTFVIWAVCPEVS